MVKCAVDCCKNDNRKHTKSKSSVTFHRFYLKLEGNTLQGTCRIETYNVTYHSQQNFFNGSLNFQIKAKIISQINISNVIDECYQLVFVLLKKNKTGDEHTYSIVFNSTKLGIKNKVITTNQGMKHLIFEAPWGSKINDFDLHVVANVANIETEMSLTCYKALHEDTELTDFELKGEDGSVHMHRVMMAAASPVMKSMLGGTWKERTEGMVKVAGVSQETLQHLKDYIYLNRLPGTGLEKLIALANYYLMDELREQCLIKLVEEIGTKEDWMVLKYISSSMLAGYFQKLWRAAEGNVVQQIKDAQKNDEDV